MRKLIIIVVSTLLPFGLWTAGCRKEQTAAFPNTPEMQALARAPEQNAPTRPPVIPAAPIDRDILNLPETTERRMVAVNDRSNRMAGAQFDSGLFSLPAGNEQFAAVPDMTPAQGGYDMQQAGMVPIPSGREFWSKPAAPVRTSGQMQAPAGVAAMMPAAPVETFSPPPAPYAAPAVPRDAVLMLPEDIPGVFMDSDSEPLSFAPRGPGQYGRPESLDSLGDALGAPPLLSSEAFASVPVSDLAFPRQDESPKAKKPLKLDLVGLLGTMRDMADTIIPPGGAHNAPAEMLAEEPAGRAMPAPPPARKFAFDTDEMRSALAPLPDITAQATRPALASGPLTMPPPMPEPLPPPDVASAVAMLMDYTPEPPLEDLFTQGSGGGTVDSAELFRSDYQEREEARPEAKALVLDDIVLPDVAGIRLEIPAQAASIGEFAAPRDLVLPAPLVDEKPEAVLEAPVRPASGNEPRKVVLQSIRERERQASDLRQIDAAAAVPPLGF